MSDLSRVIDEVKERLPIEQVVGQRVRLERKGNRLWGLCPFHAEKSPSFTVHAEQNFFKCFGCGKGGDAITFVRELDGLEFMEALRMLAEQAGVEIPERGGRPDPDRARKSDIRRQAREALQLAARAYHEALAGDGGADARRYLADRGVERESIVSFRLGWAPNARDWLTARLRRAGVSHEALEAAGLSMRSERDGTWSDRFRERLMFPVFEAGERPVGFGGRYLPGSWAEENDRGKYVNSPEGPLFPKRRLLYGVEKLQTGLRAAEDLPILVTEGYLDVLMLHQAGFPTAVAALGTAFSEDHARRLRRSGRPVALLLDADEAGRRAAARAARILVREGVEARVVELPEGTDPADLIQANQAEDLRQRVAEAWDIIEWRLSAWSRNVDLHDPQAKARAARELAEWVQATPDPVLAEAWLARSCDRLGISEDSLRRLLRPSSGASRAAPASPTVPNSQNSNSDPARENLIQNERQIVAAILLDPSLAAPFAARLQALELDDAWAAEALKWCFTRRNGGDDCGLTEALAAFEGRPAQAWLDGLRHLRLSEPRAVLERALEALPHNRERAAAGRTATGDEDLQRFRRAVSLSPHADRS